MNAVTTEVKTLDRYDIALVQLCKRRENPTLLDLKRWFGWRCELDPDYVHARDIADHLIDLFWSFDLINGPGKFGLNGMIEEAQDAHQWKFGALQDVPNDYWINWLRVLVSRLRNTEVRLLPGYTTDRIEVPGL